MPGLRVDLPEHSAVVRMPRALAALVEVRSALQALLHPLEKGRECLECCLAIGCTSDLGLERENLENLSWGLESLSLHGGKMNAKEMIHEEHQHRLIQQNSPWLR